MGSPDHRRLSTLAHTMEGSAILAVAAEVRARRAEGGEVLDLTVGDFDPREYPIPDVLRTSIQSALDEGETNYPPPHGIPALRDAVCASYRAELGLDVSPDNVLVTTGARPLVYGAFRILVDAGDTVVFPVPCWNVRYYVQLVGARPVPVPGRADDGFVPAADDVIAHLCGARLLCLNTPSNPTGTVIGPEVLEPVCRAVVEENRRREAAGERPLYVLYDHIYRLLSWGEAAHATPVGLVPEMAPYTVFVDGISKAFAATGLRVGWGVGPIDVMRRMTALLSHTGAWAPRPEQVAAARLLRDTDAVERFRASMCERLGRRLGRIHEGVQAMRRDGMPVDSRPASGAIYLTARFTPFGRRTTDGKVLEDGQDVRRYLLQTAGVAVVPLPAFGWDAEDGWFRLSVGTMGDRACEDCVHRLRRALEDLRA